VIPKILSGTNIFQHTKQKTSTMAATTMALWLYWVGCFIVAPLVLLLTLLFIVVVVGHRAYAWQRRRQSSLSCQGQNTPTNGTVMAFFHPHCSAGGGGERVLWKMVQVLGNLVEQRGLSIHQVVIYTVDAPSPTYQAGKLFFGTKRRVQESRFFTCIHT
jgi:ALG11 mannosyltransferase N-terminus